MTRARLAATLAVLLAPMACSAETGDRSAFQAKDQTFVVRPLADGLEHPWALTFLPDGALLITERPGRLRLFADGALRAEPVGGVPAVVARGQGGLHDVTLAPDFATSRQVYLCFAGPAAGGAVTRVARGRLDDANRSLTAVSTVFETSPALNSSKHFGCRIRFAPDGDLYLSVGERGERDQAQDLANGYGKVHRVTPDGAIPPDNPFLGTTGAQPSIFTWGHRNPQGLTVRPETDQVWLHEHGPRGGDEVNLLVAGANYGWPVVSHGNEYYGPRISSDTEAPGIEPPRWVWVPSIAPSGMAFYDGDAFPAWQGDLFVGGLVQELLVRLELDGDEVVAEERLLVETHGRIREVEVGPDGLIYLLTDADDGRLLRLEPDPGA